jgi:hypothetical protein
MDMLITQNEQNVNLFHIYGKIQLLSTTFELMNNI